MLGIVTLSGHEVLGQLHCDAGAGTFLVWAFTCSHACNDHSMTLWQAQHRVRHLMLVVSSHVNASMLLCLHATACKGCVYNIHPLDQSHAKCLHCPAHATACMLVKGDAGNATTT